MRLLNSDLRWYRDRLIALSVCALVALALAFGLLPRVALAYPPGGSPVPVVFVDLATQDARCLHTNPENTFFLALEADRATPNPKGYSPADNSTVAPGTNVSSWFSDETGLNLGLTDSSKTPVLTLSKTNTPTFTDPITPLTIGNDMGSLSFDNNHRECYHQNNITGKIPTTHGGLPLPPGDYTASLTAWDKDVQNNGGPDIGNHTWSFHIKAQPSISTTPSAGGTVGTAIHDAASVTGGDSPTGNVTFNLYAPGDLSCQSAPVFTDTKALGVASGNYTTAAVGIYRWRATYNGDDKNLPATSGCQDEQVTVVAAEQVAAAAAAAAAQQVQAAAVTLPKAGAGPQQQGSSAPGGGGPFGASGIVATLLLALIGSVLFALRRREAEEPKA